MKKLYASIRKSRWFPLIKAIFSIVCGVLCLMNPHAQMEKLAIYAGVGLVIYGLCRIVAGILTKNNRKMRIVNGTIGAVAVILAIADFANLSLIAKYIPVLAGFVMILCGITDLVRALVLLKNGGSRWWIGAVVSLIVLVLGFVILLKPSLVGSAFGVFMGISMLITGVSGIVAFAEYSKDR